MLKIHHRRYNKTCKVCIPGNISIWSS